MSERDVSRHSPTTRFSARVADYVRYRPRYPHAVLDALIAETGLTPDSVIADIGSGTGFSAEMFLAHGNEVYGVEPNADMRHAGEQVLAAWPRFHSIAATAEETTLPAQSMDYVLCGQSLHWFDLARARIEFARILKPGGWLAVLWNTRAVDATDFMREYEALVLEYTTDFKQIFHGNVSPQEIAGLFAAGVHVRRAFAHAQRFDFAGLLGRTTSSSYMPRAGDDRYPAMESALRALFARYAAGEHVEYHYSAELIFGHIAEVASHGGQP